MVPNLMQPIGAFEMQHNGVPPQAVSEFGSFAARLPIEQDGFPARRSSSPFDHNVGAE